MMSACEKGNYQNALFKIKDRCNVENQLSVPFCVFEQSLYSVHISFSKNRGIPSVVGPV